ncbi:hypothetical protein, variant [Cryptococcus amylolentus CBS 6039]|uniref:Uncharacterized protein n=2 Tax=Cryptococcus amylolentus TaxID=104669 RepID=A0A1E3I7Y6_9TREE|nr:hypothetical protein, variant [Cryptococcus amylolentus CBS 6039]ODN84759.1 hypothetical protein, variant [Cryptococcus amylolentus CBS 6039]ODO11510.1 hypothetical protein I350_00290 [Cryptococcus amylolentus CBS 6273]
MPRRRVSVSYSALEESRPPLLETRWGLLTYTLSRVPPRKLAALLTYAWLIFQLSDRQWIAPEVWGKAGGSIVGVLSMVTGLLLSYRFSTAIGKWDEGKKVWSEVRTTIRDGIRVLSISGGEDVSLGVNVSENDRRHDPSSGNTDDICTLVNNRTDELSGLLVGFAFALQHHLHGTRPLPQAPLCDLLPPSYLSSLKRTDARVRFAEAHAGPSGTLRRKPTGLPGSEESEGDDWEIGNLKENAEEAMSKFAEAITQSNEADSHRSLELQQQLKQLNIPESSSAIDNGTVPTLSADKQPAKSNLHSPYPPNLSLTLLKIMDAYVEGLGGLPEERGGWNVPKRERGFALIKSLNNHLGKAERLSSNPPPLPLTLHLSHLLTIYLAAIPCSLLCVVKGWPLVFITFIAGWCLLGLEALISEVSGVFGSSENHHPLPIFTQEILNESLDISPSFLRYYRSRVAARVGDDVGEVLELDRRGRRSADEWLPSFR